MNRVAFAFKLAPERVELLEGLVQEVVDDPEVDMISREPGADRVTAWLQEDPVPLLVVYSEWKIDPAEGFADFDARTDTAADRIRGMLQGVLADPDDSSMGVSAGRSHLILDWSAPAGRRGSELRCYARFVARERAAAIREFVLDMRSNGPLLGAYSRLRERAGMSRVSLWAEDVGSDETLLVELYESDDVDAALGAIAASRFELDRQIGVLSVHAMGWTHADMPRVRPLYHWTA